MFRGVCEAGACADPFVQAGGAVTAFEGYPKVCERCGLQVRITGLVALWFETGEDRVKRSWHFQCRSGRGVA